MLASIISRIIFKELGIEKTCFILGSLIKERSKALVINVKTNLTLKTPKVDAVPNLQWKAFRRYVTCPRRFEEFMATDHTRVMARVDKVASWLLTKKTMNPILGSDSKPIPGHFKVYHKNTSMIVVKMLARTGNMSCQ